MKYTASLKRCLNYYLLVLFLLFTVIPIALSGCGSSSKGGSGGPPPLTSIIAYPYGGLTLLKSDAAVTYTASLYELGNSSPIDSNATQNADGSFTFTYNSSSYTNPLYIIVTGSTKSGSAIIFESFAGTIGAPDTVVYIDELTTMATAEAVSAVADSDINISSINGTIANSGGASDIVSDAAALNDFKNMANAQISPATSANAQINPSLIGSEPDVANTLELVSGALAKCGNAPDSCNAATLNTDILGGAYSASNTIGVAQYIISSPDNSALISSLASANTNNIYGASDTPPSALTFYYTLSVPAAPSGLTATAGNTQISLNWTASAGATGYNVYELSSSTGTYALVNTAPITTGTSYTVTGLTNGTTYYFEVTAVNSAGEGPYSLISATPAIQIIPPLAPTNLVAADVVNTPEVYLSWNASAGATGYNVYESTSSTGTYALVNTAPITGISYIVSGLNNGEQYYFVITAANSAGESPYSIYAAATPELTPPSAPAFLTVTQGNTQISLNWTASAGATGYNVYESTSSTGTYALVNTAPITTGTSYTVTGLTNGTTYYFEVTAVNSAGQGSYSAFVSAAPAAVPTAPPLAPTGLTATDVTGEPQVYLSWTASAGATGYNVYESTSPGGTYALVNTAPITEIYDYIGLVSGAQYAVTALNSIGESSYSAPATVTQINNYTVGNEPDALAVDATGNVWVANYGGSGVTELNSSGQQVSGSPYTVGNEPDALAVDATGNVWVANYGGSDVTELSPTGVTIGTFPVGNEPDALAVDGTGNVWVANYGGSTTITELVNVTTGVALPLLKQTK